MRWRARNAPGTEQTGLLVEDSRRLARLVTNLLEMARRCKPAR